MSTPVDTDNSPLFIRCHINILRWPNQTSEHSEPLIAPHFLASINRAIEALEQSIRQTTLPVIGENYRLMPGPWSLNYAREVRSCRNHLDSAISELKSKWVDVLNEAKSRLGAKFRLNHYPDPSLLHGLWQVEIQPDSGNQVNSLSILKEYSIFFRPPEGVTIFEAIRWGKELEARRAAGLGPPPRE